MKIIRLLSGIFVSLCVIGMFNLLPIRLAAQRLEHAKVDSLLMLLPNLPEDTNRAKALNNLSFNFFSIDPTKGIFYGEQGLALCTRLNWEQGTANSYNAIASNYWAVNDFVRAQEFYLKALKINRKYGNKHGISANLHNIADIYEAVYNYQKAIEYYDTAAVLLKEIANKPLLSGTYSNIAFVYQRQHNYQLALEYFQKALDVAAETGNERDKAFYSGKLGLVYADMGKYQIALDYQLRALHIFRQLKDKDAIEMKLGEIGNIYLQDHQYDKAIEYFTEALYAARDATGNFNTDYQGQFTGGIGQTYLAMGLLEKAKSKFKEAIALFQTARDLENLKTYLDFLSQVEVKLGQYQIAMATYRKSMQYKDSLANSARDKEIIRREFEYQFSAEKDSLNYINQLQKAKLTALAEREQVNALTFRQRKLYLIIALILVFIAAGVFLFRYRIQQIHLKNDIAREIAEKKLREAEYQLSEAEYRRKLNDVTFAALRSQMNPHFIFNSLNTIQSYIYSNDKKNAIDFLGKFSDLIRKILESSNSETISLEQEIELLNLYLEIEKARFGGQLLANIAVDPQLHAEEINIPPMLIQPFVENAMKHGLLHLTGEKHLNIDIRRSADHDHIEVIIDDNGIGREQSAKINEKRRGHHSFANNANEKRINLINQLQEKKASLTITDKKNSDGSAAGTTVLLTLPVMEEHKI